MPYIDLTGFNPRYMLQNYSYSIWVNITDTGFASAGLNRLPIFSIEGESFPLNYNILEAGSCEAGGARGNISFWYGGAGVTAVQLCGDNITNRGWQYVVIVKNSSGIHLWQNGTLRDSANINLNSDLSNLLYLLSRKDGGFISRTKGAIDEFTLWNRSLTQDEIQYLYNRHVHYNISHSNYGNTTFKYSLEIPTVTSITNKTFYWNFSSNEYASIDPLFNTSFINQTIYPLNFSWVDYRNINISYLKIVFKDEISNQFINGSIFSSTWFYTGGSGNGTINKTLSYINATEKANHSFGNNPMKSDLRIQGATIRAESTGYSSKTITILNSYYTNTSYANITIWLTSLADSGTTPITFQVLDTTNAVQPGARVMTYRVIDGARVNINDGYTDSTGSISYYLSPLTGYTIETSKPGCSNSSYVITPTSSSYNVILNCGGTSLVTNYTYVSNIDGITYRRTPVTGPTWPGNIQFAFSVNSSKYNLTRVRFDIVQDGVVIAMNDTNNTGIKPTGNCNPKGCLLTLNYTFYSGDNVKARYYISTNVSNNDSLILLEGDAYWRFILINKNGSLVAVKRLIDNFQALMDSWGSYDCLAYNSTSCAAQSQCKWIPIFQNETYALNATTITTTQIDRSRCIMKDEYNKREFDRFVILFFILVIVVFILAKVSSYEFTHPGAFSIVFCALVIIMSYYDMFTFGGATPIPFINKWLFAGLATMGSITFFIAQYRRQTQ